MNVTFLVRNPLKLCLQLYVALIVDDAIRKYCCRVDVAIGLLSFFLSAAVKHLFKVFYYVCM